MKSQQSQKQLNQSDKEKDSSLVKKKAIKIRSKNSNKKPELVKPKMVDAWTQTDRSDFAIIKYKMQKKMQAKSLEKNKLNMMLNSQSNLDGSHSVVRKPNLGSHDSLTTNMTSSFKGSSASSYKKHGGLTDSGIRHYSQMPLKMGLAKSVTRGPDSAKSQVTPGFSRNPVKTPAKRTMLHVSKKKKDLEKGRS